MTGPTRRALLLAAAPAVAAGVGLLSAPAVAAPRGGTALSLWAGFDAEAVAAIVGHEDAPPTGWTVRSALARPPGLPSVSGGLRVRNGNAPDRPAARIWARLTELDGQAARGFLSAAISTDGPLPARWWTREFELDIPEGGAGHTAASWALADDTAMPNAAPLPGEARVVLRILR